MEYFTNTFGSSVPRPATFIVLRWPSLGYSPRNISSFEAPCSQKMKSEIPYSPCRGTRHQSRRFYWSLLQILLGTIKFDLTTCFSSLSLFTLNSQGVDVLNSANIILLPKNLDVVWMTDYRLISLIHSIAKNLSLSLCQQTCAPSLDSMISNCQSAFIKKSIHDNFLYVQNTMRRLHKAKTPTLFMTLDI